MTTPTKQPEAALVVWRLDQTDSVVARSPEDAWQVWVSTNGEDRADYAHLEWERMPDEMELTITDDNLPRDQRKQTKTCGEWAASNGRGFLCSTEW